jgi:hypothetical protein
MGLLVGVENGGNFMGRKAATVAVKAVQVPVKDSRPRSGEIKRPRKLMMDKIQHTNIHTYIHSCIHIYTHIIAFKNKQSIVEEALFSDPLQWRRWKEEEEKRKQQENEENCIMMSYFVFFATYY